jgi:hypothetical protein
MAATKKARGSDSMKSGLRTIQAKALQDAIKGFKVIDWHELGQPATELIRGTVAGSPGRAAGVVDKLLKIKEIRGLEILINGIPKPDLASIRFQLRGR